MQTPYPSSLRDATSPERGRFCSTYRQTAKSSPFGGAAERSEAERVCSPFGRAGAGAPERAHPLAENRSHPGKISIICMHRGS